MLRTEIGTRHRSLVRWSWPLLLSLLAATLIGIAHLAYVVGFRVALPSLPLWQNPSGDLAQSVLGAEAFLLDPAWHLPLAATDRLVSDGHPLPIIYTDSAPWVAILAKSLGLKTTDISVMGLVICSNFLLQPLATAFLLVAAGVRRAEVVVLGAVLGSTLPAWYMRVPGHVALASHWIVVLALALAVSAARRGVGVGVVAGLGVCGAVAAGLHAYLFAMVAVVAIGGLLADVARIGWRALPRTVAGLAVFLALSASAAWLLGFGAGGGGVGGFGLYSMNLLSPFVPQISGLSEVLTGDAGQVIDATGGQFEGYNYLGGGIMLVLGVALVAVCGPARWTRLKAPALRAAIPLALALLGLVALALSNHVFLGHRSLLKTKVPMATLFDEARSSGRFFWPVAYALLAISLVIVGKLRHRLVMSLCLAVAVALQIVDTVPLRRGVREALSTVPAPPGAEFDLWTHGALTGRDARMLPRFLCAKPEDESLIRTISLLTIRAGARTEGGPQARMRPEACTEDQFAATQVQQDPGWVSILFKHSLTAPTLFIASRSGYCAPVTVGVVCDPVHRRAVAAEGASLEPALTPLADGDRVDFSSNGEGRRIEGPGWSGPEPFGTWTDGKRATLVLPLAEGWKGAAAVSIEARAFAPPPLIGQRVEVRAGGVLLATFDVPRDFRWFRVEVPRDLWTNNLLVLDLAIPEARSPYQLQRKSDFRLLGITVRMLSVSQDGA